MFTGIIQTLGIVESLDRRADLLRLGIKASFAAEVSIGDSISVNGICLTATKIEGKTIFFDVASTTLNTTNLGNLKTKDKVNLEQALKANDKIGGHIVTGHIDTVGVIRRKVLQGEQAVFEITFERKFAVNIVEKGSVSIDGISLTVAKLHNDSFIINVIPHTMKSTTLGFKKQGDTVNIEFDIMGKYSIRNTEKILSKTPSKITEEYLREHGFLA